MDTILMQRLAALEARVAQIEMATSPRPESVPAIDVGPSGEAPPEPPDPLVATTDRKLVPHPLLHLRRDGAGGEAPPEPPEDIQDAPEPVRDIRETYREAQQAKRQATVDERQAAVTERARQRATERKIRMEQDPQEKYRMAVEEWQRRQSQEGAASGPNMAHMPVVDASPMSGPRRAHEGVPTRPGRDQDGMPHQTLGDAMVGYAGQVARTLQSQAEELTRLRRRLEQLEASAELGKHE